MGLQKPSTKTRIETTLFFASEKTFTKNAYAVLHRKNNSFLSLERRFENKD